MPTPSWDLFLTAFFIAGTAYGMMLQRERTVVTMLAIYVALVLTGMLADPIAQFFAGEKTILNSFFIRSQASPFTIQAGVFVGLIVLVTTKSGLSGDRDSGGLLSPLEVFSYSFLNTALIVSTILSFMPEEARASIAASSNMASYLMGHELWWVILPIIALLFFGWNRHPIIKQ